MGRVSQRSAVVWLLAAAFAAASVAGCSSPEDVVPGTEDVVDRSEIILASTTSTQDSGLFDELVPAFEEANPEFALKVVAVGTGEALTMGENKDADVLLVHAKSREEEFVDNGYGVSRADVMYNDFVIVGPENDPAGAGDADTASEALGNIRDNGGVFYSRGDDSGTNTKELSVWEAAGVSDPSGDWYEETGQGMGDTLRITSERQAYTLTDRATLLNLRDSLDLVVVYEGSDDLFNQYGVIVITDATNMDGAEAFAEWVTSDEGQAVIEQYGVERFGEPLFTPNAK